MGKGTTRKSVSVKGLTYQRIADYLLTLPPPPPGEKKQTKSGFLEDLIAEKLGVPTEEDRQKFAALQAAKLEAKETETEPSPEPEAPSQSEPVEASPNPPAHAMPRGPLPEFTEHAPLQAKPKTEPKPEPKAEEPSKAQEVLEERKKRPNFMQPIVKEPIVQEEKDDDPDDIPPAIRFF